MAVWQFAFSLVPLAGLIKHHGHPVSILPQYQASVPGESWQEDEESINYWNGQDRPRHLLGALEALLPPMKSWADEARMFGFQQGNDIQIWDDDISCRIDARDVDFALLAAILDIAKQWNCRIVFKDNGRVTEPEFQTVLGELKTSRAVRFLKDPVAFLAKLDGG